jgi:DNA-binding LacI/PurR family transcriptional regulator
VDLDFPAAARLAVSELAATGHDTLAFIGYPQEVIDRDINFVRRFFDAAHEAADAHRLRHILISPVELDREAVRVAVDRGLGFGAGGRLGIVVPSTQVVQRVLHTLRARDVIPGRDVSVIALCTDLTAQDCEPPVTNVSLEPRDVSRRAMRTLFQLLESTPGTAPPAIDLVTPRLTDRGTVVKGTPIRGSPSPPEKRGGTPYEPSTSTRSDRCGLSTPELQGSAAWRARRTAPSPTSDRIPRRRPA